MTSTPSFNKQITEEAAGWAIALDDGPLTYDQKAELLAWLKTSPVHLDEFLMALSLFEGVGFSSPDKSNDIDDLLREASANIVPIAAAPSPASSASPTGRRRLYWRGGAVAASLALAFVVMFQLVAPGPQQGATPDTTIVTTALGEQRSVTLDDGSIVYVNTDSRVSILYTDDYRSVEVKSGEALFEVEKDPARPFRVMAGDTISEALGTRFNVRYIDNDAEVSVIEGTVAFERQGLVFNNLRREETGGRRNDGAAVGRLEDGRVILVAGERADLNGAAQIPTVTPANTEAVSAWTSRRLIFNEDRLDVIALEFNRYNRTKLVIEDEALSAERISGVFASDDPASLVDFLKLTGDVRIVRYGSEVRIEPLTTQ